MSRLIVTQSGDYGGASKVSARQVRNGGGNYREGNSRLYTAEAQRQSVSV